MELMFSQNDPINTELRTSEGQLLYKIETPGSDLILPGKSTTISKVVPSESPDLTSEIDMQDQFCELAAIQWHLQEPSRLRYDGKEVDLQDFMPAIGPLSLVGR